MNSQRTITRLIVGSLAILCLLLAGCSSGGGSNTILNVELKDFSFTPNTFTIPAGKEITLNLTNKGTNEHEFVIMKAGTQASIPFDDNDEDNVYWEAEVEAGKSGTFKFTAPGESGTYQVVCGLGGHIEQGMTGTLAVTK